MLSSFLITPVIKENTKLKLALATPTRAPVILVKEMINTPPLVADEPNKYLLIQSKAATYLFNFSRQDFFFFLN